MQRRSSSVSFSSGCSSSWRFVGYVVYIFSRVSVGYIVYFDCVGYYIGNITFGTVLVGYIVYIIYIRVCV